MPTSIFADEWRDCLRAHFTNVIRTEDKITERTLRGVMIHEAGFTDAELKELAVLATAHVDDAPADFVPDLEILQEEAPVSVAVAMPEQVIQAMVVEDALERDAQADMLSAEASGESDMLVEDALDDDEPDMLIDETELPDVDDESDEPLDDEQLEDEPPPDPDVTQLSLF
jgi:hypothetical protein